MMTRRYRLVPLCILTTWIMSHACLGESPNEKSKDPRKIIAKAAETASKIPSISYKAQLTAEGALGNQMPRITGKIVAMRDSRGHRFRIDAARWPTSERPTGDHATPTDTIVYVNNGTDMLMVDDRRKTITTGPSKHAAAGPLGALYPEQKFLTNSPLQEELSATELGYAGTERVEGVDCDVVTVKYDTAGTRTCRLFFATQDGLLRRAEDGMMLRTTGQNQAAFGKLVLAISDLIINPDVNDKYFQLDLPTDYKREVLKPEPQAPAAPPRDGSLSPDWSLKTTDGTTVSLKGLRGKVVVLDFWATWCGPCRLAMPGMQKLYDKYKNKPVAVYGVNCWERGGSPMEFLKRSGHTYPHLLGADSVADIYGVSSIPTLIVIDPEGKIMFRMSGYDPAMETRISRLIDDALPK